MATKLEKQKIIQALCDQLEKDLIALKAAALATYEAATNEESKPENEYDTRGLEASYLAGAQAKRVGAIEELLYIFKNTPLRNFEPSESISASALVEVELLDDSGRAATSKSSLVLITGKGGGLVMSVDSQAVQTVTPTSPLGEALLGLKVGDIAVVETSNRTREYKIIGLS